ncbi:hypothetical protein T492DRAFT_891900 [Pavlovales sp. CCMP2436]|nr:hypothetical protein T492DRAFT_891900 [Pavlovales sp. CCMP2436]
MDWAEAVRILRQVADLGNAKAQSLVGFHYTLGSGTAQDITLSARYLGLAAEQGDTDALFWLGWLSESGKGTKRDMDCALGMCHEKGMGVEQSEAEAAANYAAAFALGGTFLLTTSGLQHNQALGEQPAPAPGEIQMPVRQAPELLTIQLCMRNLVLAGRVGSAGGIAEVRTGPVDGGGAAVETLASISHRREVASACCMGCGATRKLLSCGECGIATFCDRGCLALMWATHKPSCKKWRDEDSSVPIRDSEKEEEKEAEEAEEREEVDHWSVRWARAVGWAAGWASGWAASTRYAKVGSW